MTRWNKLTVAHIQLARLKAMSPTVGCHVVPRLTSATVDAPMPVPIDLFFVPGGTNDEEPRPHSRWCALPSRENVPDMRALVENLRTAR